jgi:hypothetical protein
VKCESLTLDEGSYDLQKLAKNAWKGQSSTWAVGAVTMSLTRLVVVVVVHF